ncbi:MAG: TonB-dependent receptor [Sphingobium sp.]|uniref:TonB-dependent receptor n=1 Tax=Sphingobium sp. TaxID=1912891 RepID=UPI000C628C7C|nr:TonB-dependent receptor [Sphingobium sp.]MBU0658468.1 TonB-dependent receptor [Alphaproteobacteria bacterium]MBA4753715.1 TonB-dependent receptor [Sphingobium sp.]MBS86901.1 TonB-dependent receptor [Sphingobium sp.]MBU0869781.1 TonB-dependent receptor [Alphaproteobacteria bacterium]TAJ78080.1 MAG: TonB-dependent receptor [Sphingobium sp.]
MSDLFSARPSIRALLLACAAGTLTPVAFAQEPAADDEMNITVTGRRISQSSEAIGEDKVSNVVAVTREALLSAPSGISGLKMLEQLPGFNVQTDGALGLYEFGNSVQTRAFNLDQIGFVVDGIPTGRSDAFGGSPVFRYVDNENLGVVEAAIGAGDVSLPSYSTLGPVIQYNSIAPQEEMGLFVSQSFGDQDLRRTFIRASTGRVGPFTAYVSRTKLDTELWRGPGTVDREHWEGQIHADLGGDSWARFKFVSNDFFDYDSPTISRAQYNCTVPNALGQCGRNFALIENVPNTTPGFAPLATAPGVYYSNAAYTAVYNLAINVRKDKLYGATFHAGIAEGVWAESTLYWEDKDGYGVSPDGYANSLGRYTPQAQAGLPVVAPKGVQYGLSGVGGDRYGITSKLHWEMGANTVEAGVWAEVDKYHRTQARYNTVGGAPDGAPNLDELVYLRRDYRTKRDTLQIFLKDTLKLADDRFIIDVGFKGLNLDYVHNGYREFDDFYRVVGGVGVPGYGPQINTAHYSDFFLPMAGLLYKFDERTQLFASYAENMALPKGLDDIYSVIRPGGGLVPQPAPERSKNMELGIRTNQGQLYASLAAFYTKFDNRIQSITSLIPGGGLATETFFQNVGRVRSYGVEFAGTYKPSFLNGLAYGNLNVTYNNAKFKDDVPAATPILIADKYIPDSAKWIVSGGVTVEPASWLVANISGKYTSKRWSTFTNSPGSSVPGFTVFSAYVDIGDGISFGPVKGIKVRANVDNLFDKDTLSYISPVVTGDGFFRPLSPRTFQLTISGEI